MAQKVVTHLLDDLNGKPADETVGFGLDGALYEIDLSSKNASTLRAALEVYIGAARKAGRASARGRTRNTLSVAANREQNQAIREWAKKKGLKVNDRGRIPAEVVERYHASA